MLAEKREPQAPQRIGAGEHHLHQPAGMRAAVIGDRKLQHMLEIGGQHGVAAPVREPVGIERDDHAAEDREYTEARPEQQQGQQRVPGHGGVAGPHASQRVDDLPEQHGLRELRRCKCHVGDSEQPPEFDVGAEQAENARVETQKVHDRFAGAGCRRSRISICAPLINVRLANFESSLGMVN